MAGWLAGSAIVLGTLALVAAPDAATAKPRAHARHGHHGSAHHSASGSDAHRSASGSHHAARAHRTQHLASLHWRGHHHYARYASISCVPFARAETGMNVRGNAAAWWWNAAGVYARGNAPEPGSVLDFRANARMRLGHVAVVKQVLNTREVLIDQANWGPGISRDVAVVDVSPHNDWTAVRVALGRTGTFGSVYPTYGFIYDRPDGTPGPAIEVAKADLGSLNPPPHDLRTLHGRTRHQGLTPVPAEEVAEAPAGGAR